MAAITVEQLRRRIACDTRQWGTPFELQKKTLAAIEAEPRLVICSYCDGERGFINIIGRYSFCPRCRARGVRRRHWWHFNVPLPAGELDGIRGAWSE